MSLANSVEYISFLVKESLIKKRAVHRQSLSQEKESGFEKLLKNDC